MRFAFVFALILSASTLLAQQPDAQHYAIHLTIEPNVDTIVGHSVVTIVADGGSISTVDLDFKDLTISDVQIDGQSTSNYNYNFNLLEVNLASPLAAGDTTDIRVDYHGKPYQDPSGLGGWYGGSIVANVGVGLTAEPPNLARVWYPCIDDFEDKATYSYSITTPENIEAICGGALIGETDNGDGTTTWDWRINQPITAYNASVAVGDYEVYRDTITSQLNGAEIPLAFYAPASGLGNIAGVPTAAVPIEPAFHAFEEVYGPYPLERIGYVAIGDFPAAMEHTMNIAIPRILLAAGGYQTIYAHELSHMWWGSNTNCASAQDMWLNEGIASHSESIYTDAVQGEAAARNYRRSTYQQAAVLDAHVDDGGYYALSGLQNPQPADIVYGTTNYYKGAAVVHTLANYLTPNSFYAALQDIQATVAPMAISSEDFRQALETNTGEDLSDFFDAWVYTRGHIDYALNAFDADANSATVTIRQRVKKKPALANGNRVPILIYGANGELTPERIDFDGATGTATFNLPYEPLGVMVDPDETILGSAIRQRVTLEDGDNITPPASDVNLIVGNTSETADVLVSTHYVDLGLGQLPETVLPAERFWTVSGALPNGFPLNELRFTYTNALLKERNLSDYPEDSTALYYRSFAPGATFRQLTAADGLTMNRFSDDDGQGVAILDTYKPGTYVFGANTGEIVIGIEEAQPLFRLSPNPAHTRVQLTFEQPIVADVELLDLTGRVVQHVGVQQQTAIEIAIDDLPAGLYTIRVQTAQGERFVRKLVVQ